MAWRFYAINASARWRGGSLRTHAGSSDPCAFLNLDGEKRKSRVVKKNINPQWMQTFRFPCDDGLNVTLQCGNQPVCRVLIATPSSKRRVDGVETNAP